MCDFLFVYAFLANFGIWKDLKEQQPKTYEINCYNILVSKGRPWTCKKPQSPWFYLFRGLSKWDWECLIYYWDQWFQGVWSCDRNSNFDLREHLPMINWNDVVDT